MFFPMLALSFECPREDERVEPALVDEHCFLGSAKGVAFRDTLSSSSTFNRTIATRS